MPPFKNEFSWSASRDKAFRDCLRRYYWRYYGSWEGWREVAPDSARLAYRLKQIANLKMWAGSIAHEAIEGWLRARRAGAAFEPDALREEARRRLNAGWAESTRGEWRRDPKRKTNLFEHYYKINVTAEERAALREHLFACLDRFLACESLARLLAVGPENWVALEDMNRFDVLGVPVWVVLDAACRDGDNLVIVDWKTGTEREDDHEQIHTYALFALSQWQAPPERVRGRLVYLAQDQEVELRPDPAALVEHRERIAASAGEMRALLVSPEDNEAHIDDFPMTDDLGKCARCEFKELCGR